MDPFFKDPNGKICQYTEMKDRSIYTMPYYSEADKQNINIEARKYLLGSNEELTKVRALLKPLKRIPVQVVNFSFILFNYFNCLN